jgi:hypothetical protein
MPDEHPRAEQARSLLGITVALHYKPGFEALILKAFPVFNYNVTAL